MRGWHSGTASNPDPNAAHTDQVETGAPVGTCGEVGPIGHPVGPHALAESHHLAQGPRRRGRARLASVREQVCAGSLGRLILGELATPSCCAPGNFALVWSRWGSGKFDTPSERMQRENASSCEFADPRAVDEPAATVDDGLAPPHADTSRARPAVAMIAPTPRAADGDARRGRSMARLPFITTHVPRDVENVMG